MCRAKNGSKINCPTKYQTSPQSKYENVLRQYFVKISIYHDITTATGKLQFIKRSNNSLRKSCKFYKNSNHIAAATINFTKVNRFQLSCSSLRFDQHDEVDRFQFTGSALANLKFLSLTKVKIDQVKKSKTFSLTTCKNSKAGCLRNWKSLNVQLHMQNIALYKGLDLIWPNKKLNSGILILRSQ